MAEVAAIVSAGVAVPESGYVHSPDVAGLARINTPLISSGFAASKGAVRREMPGSHQPAPGVIAASTSDPAWLPAIGAITASRSP